MISTQITDSDNDVCYAAIQGLIDSPSAFEISGRLKHRTWGIASDSRVSKMLLRIEKTLRKPPVVAKSLVFRVWDQHRYCA